MRHWANARGSSGDPLDYDPYGVPLPQVNAPPSPFGFAGEMYDGTTGLQYLRARWYQPQTGRFTQVDPFAGYLGLPETQHPYMYGLNNPTRYTDPSGRFIDPVTATAALIVGGLSLLWAQSYSSINYLA